ncbi:MAG: DNA polymerase III subunit gamma/tau [Eubacteriales bacterium]|nr:DNA polymerase III subunit gamma/tau [Eubacteriales bacterium]
MAYQALYRKWRPAGFDEVVGQTAVITTLKNQIKSDRIGHAYLFCGTRGTGKTSAAKIFARAVNCPNAKEHDGSPCNECETCKAIASGRAMNVFEIDAASNNGVDNIRDIREQVEYPPVTGRYKVYIIDEVHMLSTGAFNALLKTLEEPPAYVIFILATTDPQKIPATILSRCQRYDFKRISKGEIASHLQDIMTREGISVEDKALHYIAEAADGSMRDSLSILDQCLAYHYGETLTYDNVLDILGAEDDSKYSELFGKIIAHDVEGVLADVAVMINDGCEPGRLVNDFIMYLRNVLLVKSIGNNDVLELSEERYDKAYADAELADRDTIIRIISSLAELSNRTRFSQQKRVGLEVELIRLCTIGMPGYAAVQTNVPVNAAKAQQTAAVRNTADRAAMPTAVSHKYAVYTEDAGKASDKRNDEGGTQTAGDGRDVVDRAPVGMSAKIEVNISDRSQEQQTTAAKQNEAAQTADSGSIYGIITKNWDVLISALSASNRPLFNGVLVKEEHGNIVLVFKNRINYTLAAGNAEENGLIRLRELCAEKFGIRVNFRAREAKPGEIHIETPRATDEELAKINFPISYED